MLARTLARVESLMKQYEEMTIPLDYEEAVEEDDTENHVSNVVTSSICEANLNSHRCFHLVFTLPERHCFMCIFVVRNTHSRSHTRSSC